MKKNTDRLLKLTNQLLDFRQTETDLLKLDYQSVNIKTIIEDIYSRFLPTAKEKDIEFRLFMPKQKTIVNIDEETVTKIISNLFNNAIKYTQNIIDVYVEYKRNNEIIVIRVNSNGNRIPEEYHDKIFEPFFKLETEHTAAVPQGTGLGLPLARSLAELHHGNLFIDASVEDFNSFVLEVPATISEEAVKKNVIPEVLYNIKTKLKPQSKIFDQSRPVVLIVDDEEDMCHFIASEISDHFNVLTAYNGNEALSILKDNHVGLVISDVLMPLMDGYELCNKIKTNLDYSHIPIILLTASISLNARIEGLECGADAYLEKPFTTELLLAQIENLFKNKEVASENFMNSPFTHYKTVAVNKVDEEFMKELHSIIVKHLSESKLSVEMIAKTMGMSVSTLYRKVKAITKLNTNEYIRLYRLKKAAEMLASREYRINEVSFQVGFSSPSYFTTSFQKQFGISPSQFLKQQVQVAEPEVTV